MKRTTLLWALLALFLVASAPLITGPAGAAAVRVQPAAVTTSHQPKPGPTGAPTLPPKPDLVITAFNLDSWGGCTPGQTVFKFNVGVKNQGGSWSGVQPVVLVEDLHPGVLDAWGTGVGISPPLAPGELRGVQVAISYYSGDPSHMTAVPTHPFQATVNPNHLLQESDYSNNAAPGPAVWNGTKVIMVGAPDACLHPVPRLVPRSMPLNPTPPAS